MINFKVGDLVWLNVELLKEVGGNEFAESYKEDYPKPFRIKDIGMCSYKRRDGRTIHPPCNVCPGHINGNCFGYDGEYGSLFLLKRMGDENCPNILIRK